MIAPLNPWKNHEAEKKRVFFKSYFLVTLEEVREPHFLSWLEHTLISTL